MIYPKEGSVVHSHPAALVHAKWVDKDQQDGAQQWIEYLRADERQRTFMKAGFRPGTDLPLGPPFTSRFGVDPAQPKKPLDLTAVDPAVVSEVVNGWGDVKPPAVVTFVVDTSGSMGESGRLDRAKEGLLEVVDNMADNIDVGLVTFSDTVRPQVDPAPVRDVRFAFAEAVRKMQPNGNTALYDAIAAGVDLSDNAPASDNARRAVIVLSDGEATAGDLGLDTLLKMSTSDESPITMLACFADCANATDARGRQVAVKNVRGNNMLKATKHPVQVFFVGVGEANLQVARILAEATGAEYQGTTEEDLATVLTEFGDYF